MKREKCNQCDKRPYNKTIKDGVILCYTCRNPNKFENFLNNGDSEFRKVIRHLKLRGKPPIPKVKELRESIGEPEICYLCKRPISWGDCHIEHVIPLGKGGNNSVDNLRWSCPQCNIFKSSYTKEELKEKILIILANL